MTKTPWTSEELWWLLQAWEETAESIKYKGAKKRTIKPLQFNKIVYERFLAHSGGTSLRTVATIKHRMDVLQHSYKFICTFLENKETSGDANWFTLSKSDQRQLMKIAGGQRVIPIDKRVFNALDKVLTGKSSSTEKGDETESKRSKFSDEGEKFERSETLKQKAIEATGDSLATLSAIVKGKGAYEEESDDVPSREGNNYSKQKRQRVATAPPLTKVEVSDVLGRQSHALTDFLENRAGERLQEHERSRQERETDQKFWAAETAKDRALLRELFMDI